MNTCIHPQFEMVALLFSIQLLTLRRITLLTQLTVHFRKIFSDPDIRPRKDVDIDPYQRWVGIIALSVSLAKPVNNWRWVWVYTQFRFAIKVVNLRSVLIRQSMIKSWGIKKADINAPVKNPLFVSKFIYEVIWLFLQPILFFWSNSAF